MVFITFVWVDQRKEEQEKEFDTLANAKEWLKGQRETDFDWVEMSTEHGDIMAETYSGIMEF
ncbi:hypothetical protein HOT32_gp01 [Erwinia phage Faunus]|uniref:Uncharacterized protein n=1 Tax=Erwinia phage Faunus TaxID=2182346 RepID=A0A2U8UWS9_9CAUD|nr:hypothetical protein HOT32_gp01 [Erwinia phage Faunus]AWN08584.1 hypothetical protein [Erwinia phage Faunus]